MNNNDKECIQCKKKSNKIKIFACDSCQTSYCGDCANLTATEIKCLSLVTRSLKFFCTLCKDNDIYQYLNKIIKDKETIINDKNTIIELLNNKIALIESTKSYARAVSTTQTVKPQLQPIIKNVPAIVIKPNNFQTGLNTKKEIQQKISPKTLNISINSVKTTANGTLTVKCNSEEDAKKFIDETHNQGLNNKYNIRLAQMKKPKVKIITSSNTEMPLEEIEASLRKQNKIIKDEDHLEVTFKKTLPNGKTTIFAECSGKLFQQLMINKKVFLSWERCPVYEDLTVRRCRKCYAYDHKEAFCKNKLTCTYCGEEHKVSDCTKQNKKCNNCVSAVNKYKLDYNVEHEAYWRDCPSFKFYQQRLKNSIDYHS